MPLKPLRLIAPLCQRHIESISGSWNPVQCAMREENADAALTGLDGIASVPPPRNNFPGASTASRPEERFCCVLGYMKGNLGTLGDSELYAA